MARWLKQSTSVDVPIGPFVDSTDGVTAETSLSITQPDIRLKKNGGNWAQKAAAQTLSHEENGYYEVTLDATDTNTLGLMRLAVNESGALPIWEDFLVVTANVWDSFFGADVLDVSVVQFGGSNGTFASGRPEVNTTHAAGTAWGSGAITAASIATDAIGADEISAAAVTKIQTGLPTAVENADVYLDRANAIETGLTPRQAWRLVAAACAGKASGLETTTAIYRNAVADSKNRITATVDANGNRPAITVDLT